MAARRTQPDSIPATLSPHQAIPLLQRQIQRLDEQIMSLHDNHPDVEAWVSTTRDILNQAFGQPNGRMDTRTSEFVHADSGLPVVMVGWGEEPDPDENQERYLLKQKKRNALLKAYIEQLQDLAPPSAVTAPDQYVFHSEIEGVSGNLYRGGHYKQAALEAYIRVIEQVRTVSGIADDGDSLMNKAFSYERQTPVIQFNNLQTEAERNEQRGFMFIFKGIVGLRNLRAHSNQLFNDPRRAHEYLALASLLMRLLEIAQVKKP